MREIMFRGKRNPKYGDKRSWCYGVPYIDFDGDCIIATDCSKRVVLPETVGQYIGLSDKNGQKIFEGDIVTMPKCGDIGTVKWDDKAAMFIVEAYANWLDFEIYSGDSFEVIGNIHDTPDLLRNMEEKENA